MSVDLLSLGECMVELSRQQDGSFALAYGGDTFNTVVYACRLGLSAAYGTALGDDPYSQGILDLAAREGIDVSSVPRVPGRLPGLYFIETDAAGERRFFYWRDRAPARELFELPGAAAVERAMRTARCVYFSGVTLSLYTAGGLDRLDAALRAAREAGALIAFDNNFRPRGWGGDTARAQATFERFLRLTDIALPSFDDEQSIWGEAAPDAVLTRLTGLGVTEIVLKRGPGPVLIQHRSDRTEAAGPAQIEPVDTTAAGDSFNAGYLAARLRGLPPAEAAGLGHCIAGIVIGHRGAIVPRHATAGLARLLPAATG